MIWQKHQLTHQPSTINNLSIPNNLLNLLYLFRHIGHVFVAILSYNNIVLNADPAKFKEGFQLVCIQEFGFLFILKSFFQQCGNKVDAGFNGYHHTGLQLAPSPQKPDARTVNTVNAFWISAHVECIETKEVTKAMWKKQGKNIVLHKILNRPFNQPHSFEAFDDNLRGCHMQIFHFYSRLNHLYGAVQRI